MKFFIGLGYILIGILIFILFNKKKKLKEGVKVSKSSLVSDKLKEITNREAKYLDTMYKRAKSQGSTLNPNLLLTKPGINDFVELKEGKLVKTTDKKESFMGKIIEGQRNMKYNRTDSTNTLKSHEKNIDPLKKKILKKKAPNEMEPSQIDTAEDVCDTVTGCDNLAGKPCGYCALTGTFMQGDASGPKTDLCGESPWQIKKYWGYGSQGKCEMAKSRYLCQEVKSCTQLTGERAKVCGYCPTTGKSHPFVKSGGKMVAKYPKQDSCPGNQGLIPGDGKCVTWLQNNPCVTPQYMSGPHSSKCVDKLWKESKCTDTNKIGGLPKRDAYAQRKPASQIGTEYADMFKKMRSATDFRTASFYQKLCTGKSNVDPCNPQYSMNLDCRKKQFLEAGCDVAGQAYPQKTNVDSWPQSKNLKAEKAAISVEYKNKLLTKGSIEYKNELKNYAGEANKTILNVSDYPKKLENSLLCFGDAPEKPKGVLPGDFIKYLQNNILYKGYVYNNKPGGLVGVLWTYYKDGNNEVLRDGMSMDEQKKHFGWPDWPRKAGRDIGKDNYIGQDKLEILASCPNPPGTTLCGTSCFSILAELKDKYPRPRDCVVNEWKAWGDCNKPCGPGKKVRTRTIKYPPKRGGKPCPELSQAGTCNLGPCSNPNFTKKNEHKITLKGIKNVRYVKITAAPGKHLHMRQVEIFDDNGKLISMGKSTSGSRQGWGGRHANVVNGAYPWKNCSGNVCSLPNGQRKSVTNSWYASGPQANHTHTGGWWQVDLGKPSIVTKIVVHNRPDCCQSRLSGAQMLLLDNNSQVLEERELTGDMAQPFLFGVHSYYYCRDGPYGKVHEGKQKDWNKAGGSFSNWKPPNYGGDEDGWVKYCKSWGKNKRNWKGQGGEGQAKTAFARHSDYADSGGSCENNFTTPSLPKTTLNECAKACLNTSGCKRFTYGKGAHSSHPGKAYKPCKISNGNYTGGYCVVDTDKGRGMKSAFKSFVYDLKGEIKRKPFAPTYMGWYRDRGSRDLGKFAGNVQRWFHWWMGNGGQDTMAMQCREKCKGHKYYGLQWWGQCFCGNRAPGRHGTIGDARASKTDIYGSHSLNQGRGYFGGWRNKVFKNDAKSVYKKTIGPYSYKLHDAASQCARRGLHLCPKNALINPDTGKAKVSACSAGWTSEGKRGYPMKYSHRGCGRGNGWRQWSTNPHSRGSAHCCEHKPGGVEAPSRDETLRGYRQSGYRGAQTKTRSGRTCQKWTVQSPQRHSRTPSRYSNKGLGNHNECRNPDNEPGGIWCYTTDTGKRWEYCRPKS